MMEKEKAYAFRQVLDEVHKRDRRDPMAKPSANEAVVDLDWSIAIVPANDRLLEYAAVDLQDYFRVSMDLNLPLKAEISGKQIIITSCEPNLISDAKQIDVSGGVFTE